MNEMLTGMRNSTTTVDGFTTDINDLKIELNRNIQNEGASIRRIVDDLDFNTQARVYNSAAIKVTCALRPLRNTTTHEVIQLPGTVEGSDALLKQEINALLLNLGQELSSADRTEDRLSQLKLFIGMHK
ncbi:hypothetical protein F4860DRAFT_370257 [Xylaria cubensis]|nr:hypothetical protein F4860DRAFT_370257 [Xylaria cubensis]